MNQVEPEMEDELESEYDLQRLRVRKLGPGRSSFGSMTVRLEPDVAEIFPSAEAVNEALRFSNQSDKGKIALVLPEKSDRVSDGRSQCLLNHSLK